ncbi:MAG: MarR family transcriptional regulator [Myxococcales bacterium]|nr:MarR family transcriptional regulator [Myxococcales bacterium]
MTLTDTEPAAVMVALRRIVRHLRLADRQIEAASGVSAAQLFVLHTLVDSGPLSLAEVAERSLTDHSSVSTVVSRLVKRGLVSRRTSPSDRRRLDLRITAAGRQVIATAPPMPQPRIITAIRTMPAARRAEMVSMLECLAAAMGADEVAPRMLFEDEQPVPGALNERPRHGARSPAARASNPAGPSSRNVRTRRS